MKTLLIVFLLFGSLCGKAQVTGYNAAPVPHDMASYIEHYSIDIEDLKRVYIFKESPAYHKRLTTYYKEVLQQLAQVSFRARRSVTYGGCSLV